MGFIITSPFTRASAAVDGITTVYVNIRNFEITWDDVGEPPVRKYFIRSSYRLYRTQSATESFYSSPDFRFECTKANTTEDIPAQIYAFVKSHFFDGHTFQDVV